MTESRPRVTLRYWAAARAAAGQAEDTVNATTLADAVAAATAIHASSPQFAPVLDMCSVLHGEVPVGARPPEDVVLTDGDVLEFLPPFSGG